MTGAEADVSDSSLSLESFLGCVSIKFAFDNEDDAAKFYDWIVSQALDRNVIQIDFSKVGLTP